MGPDENLEPKNEQKQDQSFALVFLSHENRITNHGATIIAKAHGSINCLLAADASLDTTSPIFCVHRRAWAQSDVVVGRISWIFSKAMPYKDFSCIVSLPRSRLSLAKGTFVRYCRPSKVMSITLPYADS